jgi:MFS family permease
VKTDMLRSYGWHYDGMYVLTSSYHRNHRLIIFAVSQIGLVLGPLIGGALSTYTTWRWCKMTASRP